MQQAKASKHHGGIYYAFLFFVIAIWGIDPVVMSYFYAYYSASALTLIGSFFSFLAFFVLCRKKLGQLSFRYVKVAVPIGLCNSAACLLQKIGLQYTTPANYAFLEHISCIVVPLTLFLVIRKPPSRIQLGAGLLCLVGCFLLCGVELGGTLLQLGDLLCLLAGILLGACVALTGVFVKELDLSLYMLLHMLVYLLLSLASMLALGRITVDGMPLEPLRFTLSPQLLLPAALFGLLSIGICWMLKNLAIVHTDPTAVAIFSPFSAVISAVLSVLLGMDVFNARLLIGALLILFALLLSGVNSVAEERRERLRNL